MSIYSQFYFHHFSSQDCLEHTVLTPETNSISFDTTILIIQIEVQSSHHR